ncbi:hypothetical protein B7767_34475 [Streptomyces sp. 13-12-16]|uniref:hypothetical protein n=1 Tax=Streptomyces sp. 13-12-16 TaxID=1570823 RepID=UPI000A1F65A3|nr:hypothetical protein [Streptomyces sp. 13-12-16]OSP38951.1 hypothetical protein B7767_34475 [Streptomyces sp. 13-12-16]
MPETGVEEAAISWEYTLSIPNDPRAVNICRRTLRLILTMHGLIGLVDTAELLAPELVAEAEEGRGLALVRACADLWGWQPHARDGSRGRYVWCDLVAA